MVTAPLAMALLIATTLLLAGQASAQPSKDLPKNTIIEVSGLLQRATLFSEWSQNKVPQDRAEKTLLVILNQPNKDKVSDIVFIAAGQQTPNPLELSKTLNGYPNVLTGQYRHYKKACANNPRCRIKLKHGSLASRIYKNTSDFPHASTMIILVFDSQFNHLTSNNIKRKMEGAYWDLIIARTRSDKLNSLTLIGQSRGGCLAFLLAKRFRSHHSYRHIPTILQGFDPICKTNELLNTGAATYLDNPLKTASKFKSLKIDMAQVFPANSRDKLAILNVHSGAPVVSIGAHIGFVNSFSYQPHNIDLGWWKQIWVPFEHVDMGGEMSHQGSTVIPGYKHLIKYKRQFNNN